MSRFGWCVFSAALLAASPSFAQDQTAPRALNIGIGAVQFDLSGTGTAFGIAPRVTIPVAPSLAIEAGALISRIDENFGTTTLIVPEVHVHYFWQAGRLRPFAGGGIGVGYRNRAFDDRTETVLSGAGGALIDVTDRVSVRGEFRLRGFEENFAGTTAEWLGGVSLRW